ncbi:ATP-binding protein [Streptosporangium sp. NPDC023615]|uniref:ATP-binding protein n=1 Tax=Streptosporangium sp. NPDC023615 TaxID=3154794 RepID=UPI0034437B70
MLDDVLPPNGVPFWSGGEGRADQMQMAVRSLHHDPCAARTAREFAVRSLRAWELEPLIDDTGVVVSELVTNALRHGTPGAAHARPLPEVTVILCHTGHSMLCAVTDPGDRAPRLREPDYEAECGRGLQLIDGVSETWGWAPLENRGKAVWAAFALPPRGGRHLEACR